MTDTRRTFLHRTGGWFATGAMGSCLQAHADVTRSGQAVSYTHLTLPTKA